MGCLFVQYRLHLFIQAQPFFHRFHFSHSCCLLKIGIWITRIYLSNTFFFHLSSFLSPEENTLLPRKMAEIPSRRWEVWDIGCCCVKRLSHEPLGRRKLWYCQPDKWISGGIDFLQGPCTGFTHHPGVLL